jgi:hypothetical protein
MADISAGKYLLLKAEGMDGSVLRALSPKGMRRRRSLPRGC